MLQNARVQRIQAKNKCDRPCGTPCLQAVACLVPPFILL